MDASEKIHWERYNVFLASLHEKVAKGGIERFEQIIEELRPNPFCNPSFFPWPDVANLIKEAFNSEKS